MGEAVLVVPWATYTDPELARVGLSENEAKHHGIAHRVYRFPLDDIDRARAEGETEGLRSSSPRRTAGCSALRSSRRTPAS